MSHSVKIFVVGEMEGKEQGLSLFGIKMIHILLLMMIMTILLIPFTFIGGLIMCQALC